MLADDRADTPMPDRSNAGRRFECADILRPVVGDSLRNDGHRHRIARILFDQIAGYSRTIRDPDQSHSEGKQ